MSPKLGVGRSGRCNTKEAWSRTASGELAVISSPTLDSRAGFVYRAAAERLIYGRPYRWRERGMQHSICGEQYSFEWYKQVA